MYPAQLVVCLNEGSGSFAVKKGVNAGGRVAPALTTRNDMYALESAEVKDGEFVCKVRVLSGPLFAYGQFDAIWATGAYSPAGGMSMHCSNCRGSTTLALREEPTHEGGFDFGSECPAGSGSFEMSLPVVGQKKTVGVIPEGKYGVVISLDSDVDIDVSLFNTDDDDGVMGEGDAIVAWCGTGRCNKGSLNGPDEATVEYKGMQIYYTGYNGQVVNGVQKKGNEEIRITGMTTRTLTMKAFSYEAGGATVSYSWDASQSGCCKGTEQCKGEFEQALAEGEVEDVGIIPRGVTNLTIWINATNANLDVDIRLYDTEDTSRFPEGKAIIAWCGSPDLCNYGLLNGPNKASEVYNDLKYTYAGYNGINGRLGDEYITIEGTTNRELLMQAFGYSSGLAKVTYFYYL
jgi:hypothetical protein